MPRKTKKVRYYQQGDVLLIPAELPRGAKSVATAVLQEGEHTGHAHRFAGLPGHAFDVLEFRHEERGVERYAVLRETVALGHEEHKTIDVPAGTYRIGVVREFDHFENEARNVAD